MIILFKLIYTPNLQEGKHEQNKKPILKLVLSLTILVPQNKNRGKLPLFNLVLTLARGTGLEPAT